MKKVSIALLLVAVIAVAGFTLVRRSPQENRQRFMESGRRYYDKGEYEKASIQFRNALQNDPDSADAYYELALSYLHLRRWPEAYRALVSANNLFDSKNPSVHMELAELYFAAHDFDNAEKEATFVLNSQANYAPAFQVLGALLVGRNQQEKALEAFKKIVDLRQNDPVAYTNLALVEIGAHDLDNAEKHLRKAIAVDPAYAVGFLNLANFYRLQGRMPEAELVLKQGAEQNPASIEASLNLATALYEDGKADGAEAVLTELRTHNTNTVDTAIAIGDLYFQQKDLNRAESEYRRGLVAAPKNMDLEERIVEVLLDTGRLSEGQALDERLLKESPSNLTLHLARGRILMAQGKREEAISELRRQTVQSPDSAQAHQFLGWAIWQNGDLASGEDEMKRALNLDPNLLEDLQTLAQVSLAHGEFGAAVDYATRALRIQPNDPAQHSILGIAYLRLGQSEKAGQQMLAAQAIDPKNPIYHVELAAIYAAQGKKTEADGELNTALQSGRDSTDILGQVEDLRVSLHDRAKAIGDVRQFINTHPQSGDAHRILAALYADGEEYSAAKQELARALELDPKLLLAYLQLGKACQAEKDDDCAVSNYEKALELQPQFPPLLTLLGNLYIAKGDLAKAENDFEQALAVDPNAGVAASNLAWVLARQNRNLQRALVLARLASQQFPNVDSIADTLGWVEYVSGNTPEAASDLRECTRNHPDYASCHYHLGVVLVASGKKPEGRKELDTALSLNLKGDDAQDARRVIAQVRQSIPQKAVLQ